MARTLQPDRRRVAPGPAIERLERRLFLGRGLSLGALALLTGCNVTDAEYVQRVLWRMSRWNDRVQAALFDPRKLAPTYPPEAVEQPFPFNGFYPEEQAPRLDAAEFRLEIGGRVRARAPWRLAQLAALPQESQITRLICVEGWSAVGHWSGVRLQTLLERVGADTSARYVGFRCADGYYTSIDMPSALHPQTLLATGFAGGALPVRHGFPLRLRLPTKLGFKNPKHVVALFVTNDDPGGYWEDRGYNWFSGT